MGKICVIFYKIARNYLLVNWKKWLAAYYRRPKRVKMLIYIRAYLFSPPPPRILCTISYKLWVHFLDNTWFVFPIVLYFVIFMIWHKHAFWNLIKNLRCTGFRQICFWIKFILLLKHICRFFFKQIEKISYKVFRTLPLHQSWPAVKWLGKPAADPKVPGSNPG